MNKIVVILEVCVYMYACTYKKALLKESFIFVTE